MHILKSRSLLCRSELFLLAFLGKSPYFYRTLMQNRVFITGSTMKIIAACILISLASCLAAFAALPVDRSDIIKDAEVVSARGESWVRFITQGDWITAVAQQTLTSGDSLKTGSYGKLDILFVDGTQIKVHNRTSLVIKQVRRADAGEGTILGLRSGEIWSRAKSSSDALRIETPSATAAIRGTDWDIVVDDKGTSYLTVLKGAVELFNDLGKVIVAPGEQAMAEVGKPPVKIFLVQPRERVQWIISYPFDVAGSVPFHSFRKDKVMPLLAAAREKVQQDPSDVRSRFFLAGLLFDMRAYDESFSLFEEYLSAKPKDTAALAFTGLILLNRGETDAAAERFDRAAETSGSNLPPEAAAGLAGVYVRRNEIGKADALLSSYAGQDRSPLVGAVLAKFRAYQGEFLEAIAICDDYAARYPDDERFPSLAANFSLTLDEPAKAEAYLAKAFSINPDSSLAHAIEGRYYYLEGRGEAAEAAYRTSLRLDPGNSDTLRELGKVLMEKGAYEESSRMLTEAVVADSESHSSWSQRGMLMNWLEDIRKSEQYFRTAVDLNSVDYQAIDGLGFAALKSGRVEEAIQYFLRASTLEPKFAEPHIFLAIAYYQLEDVDGAMEELQLAMLLDPRDPVPHVIRYIINQDQYRPLDAIKEATRALELLPNLKSVNPVETNQKALSNLGSALLGLGMTEWASSYADESFDAFDASAYFFTANKFEDNPFVYVSQLVQGFLTDPISIGHYNRFEHIVPKPFQQLTLNTTLGSEDGGFSRRHKVHYLGYFRKPLQVKYIFDWENYESDGFRDNGYRQGNLISYGIGIKPDYRNGFFVYGGIDRSKYGDPGRTDEISEPNDTVRWNFFSINTGYNHRVGNKNNILVNFYYEKGKQRINNPDPFGTGLTAAQITTINAFGLDFARLFFDWGVYDVSSCNQVPAYAIDLDGTLRFVCPSAVLQPRVLPASIDLDPLRRSTATHEGYNYQLKQIFNVGDNHQVSYGLEYARIINDIGIENSVVFRGPALYYAWPVQVVVVPYYESGRDDLELRIVSNAVTAYLSDRWKPTERLLIEAGLFFESYKSDPSDAYNFSPRAGFAWKLHDRHILRAAYQKRLLEISDITLAPVTTAGLFFDWYDWFLTPGMQVTDYQATFESRWNNRLFSVVGVERRDLGYPKITPWSTTKSRTDIFYAAINSVLTNRIGAYVRYRHANSEVLEGYYRGNALPLLPRESFTAGLEWVSPQFIKASLKTTYASHWYGDEENNYPMPSYWTTDFSATWEPFRKHVMVSLLITNLFDQHYETDLKMPAAGRSAFVTLEYRF